MSSDHFDGKKFFNPGAQKPHGFIDLLRWMRTRDQGKWRKWIENDPQPPPPNRVAPAELRVTFVGHATVLIQFEGRNILTDPFWSMRASPLQCAGPKRLRPPVSRFEDRQPLGMLL